VLLGNFRSFRFPTPTFDPKPQTLNPDRSVAGELSELSISDADF
jgi:hypothetical protein